jgi:hypothetical protein
MVGLTLRLPDKRHMAGVQRAHRGHQGDTAAPAAKGGYGAPKRIQLTDYLHGLAGSDTG